MLSPSPLESSLSSGVSVGSAASVLASATVSSVVAVSTFLIWLSRTIFTTNSAITMTSTAIAPPSSQPVFFFSDFSGFSAGASCVGDSFASGAASAASSVCGAASSACAASSAGASVSGAAVSGAAVSADGMSSPVCALPHSGQNFASASSSAPQYLQFILVPSFLMILCLGQCCPYSNSPSGCGITMASRSTSAGYRSVSSRLSFRACSSRIAAAEHVPRAVRRPALRPAAKRERRQHQTQQHRRPDEPSPRFFALRCAPPRPSHTDSLILPQPAPFFNRMDPNGN